MTVSPTMAFIIMSVLTITFVVILIPVCRDMIRLNRLRKHGEIACGKIVEYIAKKDSDEETYTPVIEFSDTNGQLIRYISEWDQATNIPAIGEQVTLIYDRNDPRKVIKYDTSINNKGLFLILFFGIILLIIWIAAIKQEFKMNSAN